MDKQEQILAQLEKINVAVTNWQPVLDHTKLLLAKNKDHEERIERMEKSKLPIAAVSAVMGGLLSHVLKLIF